MIFAIKDEYITGHLKHILGLHFNVIQNLNLLINDQIQQFTCSLTNLDIPCNQKLFYPHINIPYQLDK